MSTLVQAEAPGSMMLFGEHAVLHGHPALVCAVDRRMRVQWRPDRSRRLVIRSALGTCEGSLDRLPDDPRFRFVLAAVETMSPTLPSGGELVIASDFPGAVGLGSSAAVTVATLAALSAAAGREPAPRRILEQARAVIRRVQGLGSGADAAASVHGGIVAFRAEPLEAEPLSGIHPITVAFAGYKTSTADVVRRVEAAADDTGDLRAALLDLTGRTAAEAADRIRRGAFDRVGPLMDVGHGLMEALGVCDARLAELVHRLRCLPGVAGAKISGSGLGDCAVGWGRPETLPPDNAWIPVGMTAQGMKVN